MKIKMRIYIKCIILSLCVFSKVAFAIEDVDFDHSSGLDLMRQYSAKYLDPDADFKIKQLRDNYERLKPSKMPLSSSPIIPKVIHQIWLGQKSIPQNYQYYLNTWRQYNPDWVIKIWREEDVIKENFPSMDLYWLARSYQERSDIVRYEILKKYGGLYIDIDIECFANFDELNYKYDFYTNFEPPAINKKKVSILNAMIGSVPNHPIIIETLETIRKDWDKVEDTFNEKFSNNKSSFARSNHNLAVQRSMYPFADSVFHFLSNADLQKYKTIILPSGYNVPVYFVNDIPIINLLSRIFRDKAKLSNQIKKRPETMSIHFHDKENSLMHDDFFANSFFDHSEIKGMIYMPLNLSDKYYLVFRKLFQLKFPTFLQYNADPVIPDVLYLSNFDDMDKKTLDKLIKKWKEMNPMFKVKVLDRADLEKYIPVSLEKLSPEMKKSIARFYLLKDEGGVFVEPNFIPASLSEFNHKYGYYGEFNKLHKLSDKLSLNMELIGALKGHSILRNMLLSFENKINKSNNIEEISVERLYIDNVLKYYSLDGDSIVFPEIYFNQKR